MKRLLPAVVVLCNAAILLPWLNRPFSSLDPNAGWFFRAIVRNYEQHGWLELHGAPLLYNLLEDPKFGFPYLSHPPGVAWLLYAFGSAEWQMRLCTFITTTIAALALYALLRRRLSAATATIAACVFCATPASAIFSQVTYASVVTACGMMMLLAVDRLRDAASSPLWRRAGFALLATIAGFAGTWADWVFVAFCAGAVPLAWSGRRIGATFRLLAAPAIGALAGAGSILWWRGTLRDVANLPSTEASITIGETFDGSIGMRPDFDAYFDAVKTQLIESYTLPLLAIAALGCLCATRRSFGLIAALLVAGVVVPALFGEHVVRKHRMFLAYFAPLVATGAGFIGGWIAARGWPVVLRGLLVTAVAAAPIVETGRLISTGDTTYYRDIGRVLSAAATTPTEAGPKRYDVAHNALVFGSYLDTERVHLPPFVDPNWVSEGMKSIPRERGVRYLWLDAEYGPTPVPLVNRPDLKAYLDGFPHQRVAELEGEFQTDPSRGEFCRIREARLYTLRESFPTQTIEQITAAIEKAQQAQLIPGVTVAVRAPNGAVWSHGFGFADLENKTPVTEDTSYRLASISKPMTAVVAMRLVELGKLDLDKPVQDYVSEFPPKRFEVSTRHLLSHLGGVRHYEGKMAEVRLNRHYFDVVKALEIFAGDPLQHEPGTKYRYTTYGYNLIGAVAQRAADEPFAALLQRYVFDPAEMSTLRVDDAWALIPNRAQGYQLRNGQLVNGHPVDTSNKVPGGGLCGRAIDLVQFGVALLQDKLLTRETRDQMWTERTTAAGKGIGYGYGFSVGTANGARFVGHGGSQPRVQTNLRIWPDSGIVVALMTNLQGAKLSALTNEIGAALEAASAQSFNHSTEPPGKK